MNFEILQLQITRSPSERTERGASLNPQFFFTLCWAQCDDGNTVDGDGCSSQCVVEDGWRCSSAGLGEPDVCSGEATAPPEGGTCDCPNGQVCAMERTSGETMKGSHSRFDITKVEYFNQLGLIFDILFINCGGS